MHNVNSMFHYAKCLCIYTLQNKVNLYMKMSGKNLGFLYNKVEITVVCYIYIIHYKAICLSHAFIYCINPNCHVKYLNQ